MSTRLTALAIAGLLAAAPLAQQAEGWGCSRSFSGSGRFGGSFSHSGSTSGGWGGFSHSGSTSYTTRSGQTYSGSHSGSGSYGWGGASYHGSYSGSAGSASYSRSVSYNGYYGGYHGCAYVAPCSGCYGSGFGAGMVTGAVLGAAAASAAKPASTTTYVYPSPGVYVAPSTTVVTTAPAGTTTVATGVPVGTTVTVLPPGFKSEMVNGVQYYQCGSTWYQMHAGSSGVSFVVVPAP